MNVCMKSQEPRENENNPGKDRGKEQEARQPQPDCRDFIQSAHHSVVITKSKQRAADKADRQHDRQNLDPQRRRIIAGRRERPGLVDKKMSEKKNALNNRDESGQTS